MLRKVLRHILADESGYGTIELLVIVAAMGVLATTLMTTLKGRMQTSAGNVSNQIDTIVNSWTTNP